MKLVVIAFLLSLTTEGSEIKTNCSQVSWVSRKENVKSKLEKTATKPRAEASKLTITE